MTVGQWGGARTGTGPKPAGSEQSVAQAQYDQERGLHERVKREQREFQLAIQRAEYLPREAQRQAAATIIAVLTQGLRSIPDNLERTHALGPDVLDAITAQIDASLTECATALRGMTNDA